MPLPMTRTSLSTGTRATFPCRPERVKGRRGSGVFDLGGAMPVSSREMRPAAVAGLVGWATLVLACEAWADVYTYRDAHGTLIFTNAPAEPSRLVIREPPLPPAPPILAVRPPGEVVGEHTPYDDLIRQVAARYDVEYALVKAIIKAESAFDTYAISRKGALGLMQLMPATATLHRVRDVFVPRDNIEGGCRHLRMLLDRYGGNLPLAIAAYNAGTQRVEEAGGVPPIPETREYLARVLRYRAMYAREGGHVLASRR
jgi:soluble lytic murein transglycosylase